MNLLQTDTTLPYGFNSIHEKHSNPEPIYNILENFQIAFCENLQTIRNGYCKKNTTSDYHSELYSFMAMQNYI